MQTPSVVHRIAKSTIRNLDDLMNFRSLNQNHRDVIDNYSYDIWKMLMTQENLNKSASIDFIPFLNKYLEFRLSEDEQLPKLSLLQPLFLSIKHNQQDFFVALKSSEVYKKMEADGKFHVALPVVFGVILKNIEIVNSVLDADPDPLLRNPIVISHYSYGNRNPGPEFVHIKDIVEDWFISNDYNVFEGTHSPDGFDARFDKIFFAADYPLLHIVAQHGDLEMMKSLVARGFNILDDFINGNVEDISVLGFALQSGNLELVHYVYSLRGEDSRQERPDDLSPGMLDLYERLNPNQTHQIPAEINNYNQAEVDMFVRFSNNVHTDDFIAAILWFGNIAYLPLAQLALEMRKSTVYNTILIDEYNSFHEGNSRLRAGFAPLFNRMKELGVV